MAPKAPDYKELMAIVDWANLTADIREFSLNIGDVALHISRNEHAAASPHVFAPVAGTQSAVAAAAPIAAGAPPPVAPVARSPLVEVGADEVVINAPMVGTFYASPKPGQPPFVAVGDSVEATSVLCIVEVMKLMNNIEAGVEGTVARILVSNEQAVQYGQPLMVIKRS